MIARINESAPLNLDKAKALADEFGGTISYRSVISKAKSLGVEYVSKAPAAKKPQDQQPTKAMMLSQIRERANLQEREGDLIKSELELLLSLLG